MWDGKHVPSRTSVIKRNILGRRVVDVVGPAGPMMYAIGYLSCDADNALFPLASQIFVAFPAASDVPFRAGAAR